MLSSKTRKNLGKRINNQQGFTLLEVMVVVVIIAIMAAAVVPNLIDNIADAQINTAKGDIKNIENQLKLYKMDNFQYPSTDQGIEALVSKPSGEPAAKGWKQRLDKLPKDPWKNQYKYLNLGGGKIEIYSLGKDNVKSDDDVSNQDE